MELHHLSRIVMMFPNMAVSRFACFKIRKTLLEQGLANDEEIVYSLLICRKCSQKLQPGINCDVSIGGKKGKFLNCAVYKCRLCNTKTKFGGVAKGLNRYQTDKKGIKKVEETRVNKEEENKLKDMYVKPEMRSLSKETKKKSLIESFFESTQESSLYKIFH